MAISTPPAAPQRGDRTTFAARVDAFITWLIGFVSELNVFIASLTSLSAGGAYSLSYTFSTSASEVDPGAGKLGLSSSPQNTSIALRVNTTSGGVDVLGLLNDFDDSTSVVLGTVRLQKVGDPTKWLVFNVTAVVPMTGYMRLTVVNRGGSAPSPFVAGDALQLFFQRTGDKGDTNSGQATLHLREERASSAASTAPTNLASGVYRRPLNVAKVNTITGASLASDQFVLPIGSYDVTAESLSLVSTGTALQKYWHKMALYNVTDAAYVVIGQNGLSYDPTNNQNYVQMASPSLNGSFSVSGSAKTFELRHLTPNAVMTAAPPAGAGQVEVYTDLIIKKTS